MQMHMDLNEGRFLEIGCLECRHDVLASISIATPVRMFIVSLDCDECGTQLIEWDSLTNADAS